MSLLITFLGLFGLAGSAKYMHKQNVDDKRYRIENDPKNTIPNKYSPGYTQYKEDYSKWEDRYKIYKNYCSQVENIWTNKLNEMIRYSGKAKRVEDAFNEFGIYFEGLGVGSYWDIPRNRKYNLFTEKKYSLSYLPTSNIRPTTRPNNLCPAKIRVSSIASVTIPDPKYASLSEFNQERLYFENIIIQARYGFETHNKDKIFLLDKNGCYSKTISDFENEAITETKILRRKYEKAGFVFPKFAEEYSAYEKWINPANRNYTKYNT